MIRVSAPLSNAKVAIQVLYDINNKFNSSIQTLYNINNKFNSAIRVLSDVNNFINTCKSILSNINNKINTKKLVLNNINNDVRFIRSWQVPGDAGFQSRGKEYIKVYIGGVEQTDVDVDSININKSLNSAHTAFFELGRAYDASKPAMEALVLIKYDNWTLYRGYIVSINPSDKPDTITINCNDEYWLENRTKKYFFVGHKPTDNKEKYYNTIQTALSTECGLSVDVGNFVPQTINNFGVGEADTVSSLIQATGNYGFYYDVSGTKILWRAGEGSVIDLEAQSLGTNIGLYQIIVHKIRDTIEGLINKLRVQMGEKVIRSFNNEGGSRTYTGYRYRHFSVYLHADWYSRYEVLSKNSSTGYGWDNHKPEDDDLYKDVFKKYTIPYLDRTLSSWSDRRPPILEVYNPGGWWGGIYSGRPKTVLDEGFTIDYENRIVTLNEPQYLWRVDKYNRFISIRAPLLKLTLWKKDYYTHTEDPSDDPETDVSNPLMFFTDKMGSYSTTIMNDLDLSSLTIQEGGDYYDENNEFQHVPSWDDTEFAGDYADWQLSKTCDRKISGTINITLDAACFYDIDLRKRIMINNVLSSSCNITSIRYNISTFTVTLQIENSRNYKRTISLQSRGE